MSGAAPPRLSGWAAYSSSRPPRWIYFKGWGRSIEGMGETEKEQMEEKKLASTPHEVPSNFSAMVATIERIKLIFARRLLFQCVLTQEANCLQKSESLPSVSSSHTPDFRKILPRHVNHQKCCRRPTTMISLSH